MTVDSVSTLGHSVRRQPQWPVVDRTRHLIDRLLHLALLLQHLVPKFRICWVWY